MKFGHKVEVHTVKATDKSRRQEDDIDDREYFDDFVLLDIYQTKKSILEVVQTVKSKSGIVEK